MHRMNPTDGHNLPYWWSSLLAGFSVLSLQDYVFIVGAVISAYFTIKTYYTKRQDERERLEEERKRTRLLEEYLRDVASKPEHERPATAEVITEAMKKVGYVGD
uniref:Holin n=1 Tax=Myoviridae sp. ctdyF5 TaxID=2825144 RepID=A0A8S5U7K2_9CAUD|nr:MAG TPA: holin [Myoviridae sp. ctdyF5]